MFVVKMFVDEEHVATFSVREFEVDYRTMTFHCLRENSEESYQCLYMISLAIPIWELQMKF